MAHNRVRTKPRRVSFQGERGAFSEQAAQAFFGRRIVTVPLQGFQDVFESVTNRKAGAAVIPIENSLFGSIHQNYDLLQRYDLKIIGEIKLRIVHCLLAMRGVRMRGIKRIYSHPQALGQCEEFLSRFKNLETVPAYDTAGAAKMIREHRDMEAAAIAGLQAARVYKLSVLRRNLESNHQNYTRFLVLARGEVRPKHNAKTSIIFSAKDIPGALFRALGVFALRDINLFKIESRPIAGKPWEYLFYLDFSGAHVDEVSRYALDHLSEISTSMKILGSYEHGITIKA
ncbi:MAG: prephenate dehydratase [Bacteroidota bacterium]